MHADAMAIHEACRESGDMQGNCMYAASSVAVKSKPPGSLFDCGEPLRCCHVAPCRCDATMWHHDGQVKSHLVELCFNFFI
ncbi:hypothetical protein V6N12_006980 [Hibiscus sabdariffa]|uniref:Uncharacterized protein n=1 Tax=Hibiscus sabdariffa TaxID=183260 RepID=A0ABR2F0E1_9ROSI